MERALSHGQGWRAARPHPLKVPWLLIAWPVLIVCSWGLIALPFVLWGWQGLWAYSILAGVYALLSWHDRPRVKA